MRQTFASLVGVGDSYFAAGEGATTKGAVGKIQNPDPFNFPFSLWPLILLVMLIGTFR